MLQCKANTRFPVIRVGGDKGARAVLASVNQYLEQNYPGIEALTLADLGNAVTGADGNLTVYFSRRGFGQQGAYIRNISVIADYPSARDSKPVITVKLE